MICSNDESTGHLVRNRMESHAYFGVGAGRQATSSSVPTLRKSQLARLAHSAFITRIIPASDSSRDHGRPGIKNMF